MNCVYADLYEILHDFRYISAGVQPEVQPVFMKGIGQLFVIGFVETAKHLTYGMAQIYGNTFGL